VSDQYSYGGSFNDAWPAWSPTGDWLVFSQFDTTPTVPWLIRLAYQDRGSSKGTRILPTGRDISFPVASVSVSPDGNWIVFESWPDGSNHDIYRMDISGNNLGQLTSDPGYDFTPAWRPGTP
jgi:Tol biopolymer transport system component